MRKTERTAMHSLNEVRYDWAIGAGKELRNKSRSFPMITLAGLILPVLLALNCDAQATRQNGRPDVQDAYGPNYRHADTFRAPPRRQPPPCEGDLTGRVR